MLKYLNFMLLRMSINGKNYFLYSFLPTNKMINCQKNYSPNILYMVLFYLFLSWIIITKLSYKKKSEIKNFFILKEYFFIQNIN